MTISRLRSIQVERTESESPYDHHSWLLQIPAMFHLQMNFLWLINKSHYGESDGSVNEYSTLSSHIQALHRKKIPPGAAPFHHLEDIAIHSFYARVLALFYTQIKALSPECDVQDPEAVAGYIRSLDPSRFHKLVEDVYNTAFSLDTSRHLNEPDSAQPSARQQKKSSSARTAARKKRPSPTERGSSIGTESQKDDEELMNHLRFLQEMETYLTLKYAIRHGDIGLIMRVIPQCCIYFHGGPAKNYAREMIICGGFCQQMHVLHP